jgi:hypothetical protein
MCDDNQYKIIKMYSKEYKLKCKKLYNNMIINILIITNKRKNIRTRNKVCKTVALATLHCGEFIMTRTLVRQ